MRTNRTMLCAECAVRFCPAASCPRCANETLYDLTSKVGRTLAAVALRRQQKLSLLDRLGRWFVVSLPNHLKENKSEALDSLLFVIIGIPWITITIVSFFALFFAPSIVFAVVPAVAVAHFNPELPTWVIVLIVLAGIATGLPVLKLWWGEIATQILDRLKAWRSRLEEYTPTSTRTLQVGLAKDAPPPSVDPQQSTFRGVVRMLKPMPSLLSRTPCVAFRLVGRSPIGPVDDAGGSSFEVLGEDGETVRVELGEATIDLPVDEKRRATGVGEAKEFLENRGALLLDGWVHLSEGLLTDGDMVEIRGPCQQVSQSDGYRKATWRRVFVERPGSPLVITRR